VAKISRRKRRRARYQTPDTLGRRLILRAKFMVSGLAVIAFSTFGIWYGLAHGSSEIWYIEFPYLIGVLIFVGSVFWNYGLFLLIMLALQTREWKPPFKIRINIEETLSNADRLRVFLAALVLGFTIPLSFEAIDKLTSSFGYVKTSEKRSFVTKYSRTR
jgi:hypothetical protein